MARLDPPRPAVRGGELCPQPAALSSRGDSSSVHRSASAQSLFSGSGCCQCSLASLWPQEGHPKLCAHRPLQQAHLLCLNPDLICAEGQDPRAGQYRGGLQLWACLCPLGQCGGLLRSWWEGRPDGLHAGPRPWDDMGLQAWLEGRTHRGASLESGEGGVEGVSLPPSLIRQCGCFCELVGQEDGQRPRVARLPSACW